MEAWRAMRRVCSSVNDVEGRPLHWAGNLSFICRHKSANNSDFKSNRAPSTFHAQQILRRHDTTIMFRKRNPQTKWPQRPYTKLQPSSSSASSPSPPLGGLIKEITGPDFHAQQDDSQAHVGISDVELVASYNWVNKDDPEILVPGKYAISNILKTHY